MARRSAQRGAVSDPVILEFRFRPYESGADVNTEGTGQDASRAELARRLNASIYKAGQSLRSQRGEEFELTFFCACGCLAEIRRSLREYVTRGAVLAGHSRPDGISARPPFQGE